MLYFSLFQPEPVSSVTQPTVDAAEAAAAIN
jgi:hypothetical protein